MADVVDLLRGAAEDPDRVRATLKGVMRDAVREIESLRARLSQAGAGGVVPWPAGQGGGWTINTDFLEQVAKDMGDWRVDIQPEQIEAVLMASSVVAALAASSNAGEPTKLTDDMLGRFCFPGISPPEVPIGQLERGAFERWAAKEWQNSNPPDNAWKGWIARAQFADRPTPSSPVSSPSPAGGVREALELARILYESTHSVMRAHHGDGGSFLDFAELDQSERDRLTAMAQAAMAALSSPATGEVVERITEYLATGGLFNPEQMDHAAVRDLLIDARAALNPAPGHGEGGL